MRGLRTIFLHIIPGCLSLLTLVSGFTFLGIPGRAGRLMGSEMRTDTVKNVLQCKILCEHQSRCKSFNYNVKTGECTSNYQDLLTANQPASLDAHPGMVFAEKRLVGQVMILTHTERKMFYLTTHSTHFIYGYMASDIWLRTILIVRKETRCRHIGYSYRLAARVLLYAPSHRQDNTYHGLCYTSRGALVGTRNSSMGPPHEGSIRRPTAP